MEDLKNIEAYREIIEIRKTLKSVQQLSWDINNVDKRYPLDTLAEDELPDVLEVYKDLKVRLGDLIFYAREEEPF